MKRHRSTPGILLGLVAVAGSLLGCTATGPLPPETGAAPAVAPAPPDGPLTVDAAVALALRHDPELRAARHRVSAAAWQRIQASLPSNPTLAGSLDPTEWVARLAVGVADLLDLGGRRRAAVRSGQSREEQAVLAVLQRERAVVRAVRSDVAEVWARERQVRILTEHVALMDEILAIARQQRALGELSARDVLRLERERATAAMERSDHALWLQQAAARLARWLGRPVAQRDALAPPDDLDFALAGDRLAPEAIDLGLVRRPELAAIAARAREQQAQLAVARVAWLADLEAGPYLKRGDGPVVGGGHLAVTLPLFDRGQAQSAARTSELAALADEMLAMQAAILLEIHEAALRLRHAQQRARIERPAARLLATSDHNLVRAARQLGAASEVDERLARLAVLEADLAAEAARLDELRAQADLAAALGDRGEANGGAAQRAPRNESDDHGED